MVCELTIKKSSVTSTFRDDIRMSEKVALVTSTASDLPKEIAEKHNITVVNAYVNFGAISYTNEDMTLGEFHEKMEKSSKSDFPKTSQPSAQDFMEAYEKLKGEGYTKIISVHVSGVLSGTINSANIAAGMLDGVDITVIDSHGASFVTASCVERAAELLARGKSPEEIKSTIEEFALESKAYFSVSTLDNLVKGGRMGKIRYRFGKLLNIKPVLRLYKDEITAIEKTRGIDKSRDKVYELATKDFKNIDKFRYIVAHSSLPELADITEKKLKSDFPNAVGYQSEIGMVISVHAGRGALMIYTYPDT